jgi:hypothetical protein
MADGLAGWLYGERVAIVDRERGRPRLTYTSEALGRYALGTPLLSLSLPVGNRRYPQGTVRPRRDRRRSHRSDRNDRAAARAAALSGITERANSR